jgi:hypothetical protein
MTHFRKRGGKAPCAPMTVALALALVGCGASSGSPDYDSGVGGPVSGLADNHCSGTDPIVVDMASCHPDAAAPGNPVDVPDGGAAEPEAPVLFNAEGDDDDCKYHVKFRITAARQGQNATIEVTVTQLANGQPALGAAVDIEGFLADNDVHVLPNNNTATTDRGGGVYVVSPVKFDATGRWLIRFHFYHDCVDTNEDSPHSHVAFYVDVAP